MADEMRAPVRHKRRLAIAAGAVVVAAGVGAAGVYASSGEGPAATDARTADVQLTPGAVDRGANPSRFARAVVRALPGSPSVTGEVRYARDGSDYDVIDTRDPQGEGFDLQVFARFDRDEFGDLTERHVAGGILWVGADDDGLTSVYFQNARGTAIRLASNSPSGHPVSIDGLTALAPAIVQAVEAAGGLT